ncbi:MAG: peptidoglycan DD-metalloendopeptidase family protein [Pseudomonadota bacterium]
MRFILFLLALGVAGRAVADTADEARAKLLEATELVASAETARDRVDALTDAVRAYEAGLQAMRGEVRRLTLAERELEAALAQEQGDISTLLALMQNATEQTETQSLLHPGSAVDTIRAGTLASALVPNLYAQASELEDRLAALEDVRAVIEAAEASVAEGLDGVRKARIAMGDALRDRTELPPRLATNAAAMEALVNSAETLAALADSLMTEDAATEGASGTGWQPPVAGEIIGGFAPDAGRTGWSVSTAPRALLTSPMDANVRFSGEFPGWGTVVILETEGASLLMMAGLSSSYVALGQVVGAGAPLGLAGAGQSAAQDNLNVRGGDVSLFDDETVYIELRQGGVPVDPATRLMLEQEQG